MALFMLKANFCLVWFSSFNYKGNLTISYQKELSQPAGLADEGKGVDMIFLGTLELRPSKRGRNRFPSMGEVSANHCPK